MDATFCCDQRTLNNCFAISLLAAMVMDWTLLSRAPETGREFAGSPLVPSVSASPQGDFQIGLLGRF